MPPGRKEREADRQTERQTDRHTDRQTDTHTHTHIHIHTHTHTHTHLAVEEPEARIGGVRAAGHVPPHLMATRVQPVSLTRARARTHVHTRTRTPPTHIPTHRGRGKDGSKTQRCEHSISNTALALKNTTLEQSTLAL